MASFGRGLLKGSLVGAGAAVGLGVNPWLGAGIAGMAGKVRAPITAGEKPDPKSKAREESAAGRAIKPTDDFHSAILKLDKTIVANYKVSLKNNIGIQRIQKMLAGPGAARAKEMRMESGIGGAPPIIMMGGPGGKDGGKGGGLPWWILPLLGLIAGTIGSGTPPMNVGRVGRAPPGKFITKWNIKSLEIKMLENFKRLETNLKPKTGGRGGIAEWLTRRLNILETNLKPKGYAGRGGMAEWLMRRLNVLETNLKPKGYAGRGGIAEWLTRRLNVLETNLKPKGYAGRGGMAEWLTRRLNVLETNLKPKGYAGRGGMAEWLTRRLNVLETNLKPKGYAGRGGMAEWLMRRLNTLETNLKPKGYAGRGGMAEWLTRRLNVLETNLKPKGYAGRGGMAEWLMRRLNVLETNLKPKGYAGRGGMAEWLTRRLNTLETNLKPKGPAGRGGMAEWLRQRFNTLETNLKPKGYAGRGGMAEWLMRRLNVLETNLKPKGYAGRGGMAEWLSRRLNILETNLKPKGYAGRGGMAEWLMRRLNTLETNLKPKGAPKVSTGGRGSGWLEMISRQISGLRSALTGEPVVEVKTPSRAAPRIKLITGMGYLGQMFGGLAKGQVKLGGIVTSALTGIHSRIRGVSPNVEKFIMREHRLTGEKISGWLGVDAKGVGAGARGFNIAELIKLYGAQTQRGVEAEARTTSERGTKGKVRTYADLYTGEATQKTTHMKAQGITAKIKALLGPINLKFFGVKKTIRPSIWNSFAGRFAKAKDAARLMTSLPKPLRSLVGLVLIGYIAFAIIWIIMEYEFGMLGEPGSAEAQANMAMKMGKLILYLGAIGVTWMVVQSVLTLAVRIIFALMGVGAVATGVGIPFGIASFIFGWWASDRIVSYIMGLMGLGPAIEPDSKEHTDNRGALAAALVVKITAATEGSVLEGPVDRGAAMLAAMGAYSQASPEERAAAAKAFTGGTGSSGAATGTVVTGTVAAPGFTSTHGQTMESAQIRRMTDKSAMSKWLTGERGDSPQGKGGILTLLKTASGVRYRVATRFAAQFAMFVAELEGPPNNYKIKTISSKRETNIRDVKWSFHTLGMAIDINRDQNRDVYYLKKNMGGRSGSAGYNRVTRNSDGTETPMIGPKRKVWNPKDKSQTDMPANIGAMAAKYGLGWGGNWSYQWGKGKYLQYKDPMHFSAARGELGKADIKSQKLGQGLTPELLESGWVVPVGTGADKQYYSIPMGASAFMKGGNLPEISPAVFGTLPKHIQEQITRYKVLQSAALSQGGNGGINVDNSAPIAVVYNEGPRMSHFENLDFGAALASSDLGIPNTGRDGQNRAWS